LLIAIWPAISDLHFHNNPVTGKSENLEIIDNIVLTLWRKFDRVDPVTASQAG
jgi:hypothetical protein